ncbi:MAG: TMEM165/GDT1 family protein [Candidatus Bathyarchaeota archaeon]|jgi:putative Ca2+/H+ antiporter (TMEM165/GDT1 family)|nr:TMEM165/GDT1 family protein [Candidatus Bathyarchaeota archaeon]
MDLTPLIASFALFALMEFGDKTHIAVITLSMKNRPLDVFIGALAAFALVDGVSVVFGGLIANLLPTFWINVGSGILFLAFGVLTLMNREEEEKIKEDNRNAIVSTLSVVTLMELGDKTQFASFVLAARYGSPLLVFIGIMLGSALITGSGVLIGKGLMRVVPERYLRYVAAALFIVFGVLFLAAAFLGIELI